MMQREDTSIGIDEAIVQLQGEVGALNAEIRDLRWKLEALEHKRASLTVGLAILRKLVKERDKRDG